MHRADARVKLPVALAFIFATSSLPVGLWPAFGVMLLIVWTAAALSGVGLVRVFFRSLVAVPFMLIALPTVFTKPGATIFELTTPLITLTATDEGLAFFATVILKSWLSVTAAALLTSTTPAFSLLSALRSLKLPAILVSIVMLMYRYLFVLVDETQRLLRARTARSASTGAGAGGGTVVWRAKGAGGMAGSLFIRTLDRSERIYLAMLARGYDGRILQSRQTPLPGSAYAQIALFATTFATIAILARILP